VGWTSARSALRLFEVGTFVEFLDYKMPVWHSHFVPPVGFALAAIICLLKAAEFALYPDRERDAEPLE
jgi:hypothetical protein